MTDALPSTTFRFYSWDQGRRHRDTRCLGANSATLKKELNGLSIQVNTKMVGWGKRFKFIYSGSSIHGVAAVDWDQIDPPNDTFCGAFAPREPRFKRHIARFEAKPFGFYTLVSPQVTRRRWLLPTQRDCQLAHSMHSRGGDALPGRLGALDFSTLVRRCWRTRARSSRGRWPRTPWPQGPSQQRGAFGCESCCEQGSARRQCSR